MRIWRDIPTRQFIEQRLKAIKQIDEVRKAGPQTAQILNAVEGYHRMRKDSMECLGIRKKALEDIADKIASVIKAERTQAGVKHRMEVSVSFDALLDALGRRASAKARYLGILLAYYGNNQAEVLDPGHLIGMLDAARSGRFSYAGINRTRAPGKTGSDTP